jgi:hypothetical protein
VFYDFVRRIWGSSVSVLCIDRRSIPGRGKGFFSLACVRACGKHGRGEKSVQVFWRESPREGDHLEDQGVDEKMGSEWILGRLAWGVWIGCNWLRTETGGGLL